MPNTSIVRGVLVASLLLEVTAASVACKKKDDTKPATPGKAPMAMVDAGRAAAPTPTTATPTPTPAAGADAAVAAAPAGAGSPEQSVADFLKVVAAGDDKAIWAFISDKSKKWLTTGEQGQVLAAVKEAPDDQLGEIAKAAGLTPADLKKLDVESLARVMIVTEIKKNKDEIVGSKWKGAEVTGDQAICNLTKPDGKEDVIVLVREGGVWKMDVEESAKRDPDRDAE